MAGIRCIWHITEVHSPVRNWRNIPAEKSMKKCKMFDSGRDCPNRQCHFYCVDYFPFVLDRMRTDFFFFKRVKMSKREQSIVEYFAEHEGYRCGYCGSSDTNCSHGMLSVLLCSCHFSVLKVTV